MASSGVSKDKFAFIIQSMAPTMASFIPISRYIYCTVLNLIYISLPLSLPLQLDWCSVGLC